MACQALIDRFKCSIQMQVKSFQGEPRKKRADLFPGTRQILFVTLICSIASIGSSILMIDQTDRFDAVDLDRKLNVFQNHLVIMYTTGERDDIKVIISKANSDPRLQELLQAIIHAMDHQGIEMDDWFLLFRRGHGC